MINLDLIFKNDFECDYNNLEIIIENNEEIEITEKNEKVFTDGIDNYYRFINDI